MIYRLPAGVPMCANPEPEIYGVSKSELVDILCRVKANPSEGWNGRTEKKVAKVLWGGKKRLFYLMFLVGQFSDWRCEPGR
jgi:hypothetical protein